MLIKARGVQPRHYQREGIEFLWTKKRALLTDAPGLGKTPQAALAAEPPCLVVVPNYLVKQWADWLNKHLPTCSVSMARGDRFKKQAAIDADADFTIINIEMMRTHYEQLVELAASGKWNTVIFDESHHLRNKGSSQSMAAVVLARHIRRVYELTATPIWKDPDDLFMQLRILQPQVFTSYWDFVDMYMTVDASKYGTKILGVKRDMRQELDELLDVMRIGRSYAQAGREVPPAIPETILLDFDPQQQRTYDTARDAWAILELNEIMTNYMKVMHTLRMMTMCPQKVEEVVARATEDNRPCVIFVWYQESALAIAEALNKANPDSAQWITGDIPVDDRPVLANGSRTVVATLGSLSEGVDLSWARTVIFAEENWPPGSHIQSLARVRRERQLEYIDSPSLWDEVLAQLDSRELNREPVKIYFIQMKNSIDEVVHSTAMRREATLRDVIKESLGIRG